MRFKMVVDHVQLALNLYLRSSIRAMVILFDFRNYVNSVNSCQLVGLDFVIMIGKTINLRTHHVLEDVEIH